MLLKRDEGDKARRFRETALPQLDALYTLARYMTRNPTDADDAVQECFLRAYRYFDGAQVDNVKPWLMAILRNVCRAEYARRSANGVTSLEMDVVSNVVPLWQEEPESPEHGRLRQEDAASIRELLTALPVQFREVIVLRDIEDLSYREIAQALDVPIGTVMSRLARGRGMLRAAWFRLETPQVIDGQFSRLEQPL
jgi:RNA polymerase sigma-70 factor (ECF subfamily)